MASTSSTMACLLGPQLLKKPLDGYCSRIVFNNDSNVFQPTYLYKQFCDYDESSFNQSSFNATIENGVCGEKCLQSSNCHPFFAELELAEKNMVPGTGKGNWTKNLKSSYMNKGEMVTAKGYNSTAYDLLNVSMNHILGR